ncbi:MAG TPA: hypothetical protein VLU25_07790 [Acidobacteriota bacterium]|nr:hypothetical protein [Acidobacteriota bacterium]
MAASQESTIEGPCGLGVSGVQRIIDDLDQAEMQLGDSLQRLEEIAWIEAPLERFSGVTLRRSELPPQEACSSCDDLLRRLAAVSNLVSSESRTRAALESGRISLQDIGESLEKAETLCTARRQVLDVRIREEDLVYFTWTATWRTYREMKEALSRPTFESFCR